MKILKGEKPIPGSQYVWEEEFRIKVLTLEKRDIIKRLSKNKPLREIEE